MSTGGSFLRTKRLEVVSAGRKFGSDIIDAISLFVSILNDTNDSSFTSQLRNTKRWTLTLYKSVIPISWIYNRTDSHVVVFFRWDKWNSLCSCGNGCDASSVAQDARIFPPGSFESWKQMTMKAPGHQHCYHHYPWALFPPLHTAHQLQAALLVCLMNVQKIHYDCYHSTRAVLYLYADYCHRSHDFAHNWKHLIYE